VIGSAGQSELLAKRTIASCRRKFLQSGEVTILHCQKFVTDEISGCLDRNRRANIVKPGSGNESLPAARMRGYGVRRSSASIKNWRRFRLGQPIACVVHCRSEPNATIQSDPYPYAPSE